MSSLTPTRLLTPKRGLTWIMVHSLVRRKLARVLRGCGITRRLHDTSCPAPDNHLSGGKQWDITAKAILLDASRVPTPHIRTTTGSPGWDIQLYVRVHDPPSAVASHVMLF